MKLHRFGRRSRHLSLAVGASLLLVLTAACGGSSEPSGNTDTDGITAPVLEGLDQAERDRVAGLIAEAKNQSLTWIDSVVAPESATAMFNEFKTLYNLPDVSLTYERLTSGELSSRLQQEVMARRVNTDFFGVASPRLLAELDKAGALLDYESPQSVHYADSSKYVTQKPGRWIAPVAYSFAVVVNPAIYPKEITSWADLADPELRGNWDVPNVAANEGSLYWYVGLRSVLPLSTFEAWAANEPMTSTGSSVQEAQKVAQGQIAISITAGFRVSQTVAQTQVPLRVFHPKEGAVLSGQSYAIVNGTRNEALAKLFMDFLLSKRCQEMYTQLEGIPSFYPGVELSAEQRQYQPVLADLNLIPLDTSALTDEDLDKYRSEWTSTFNR